MHSTSVYYGHARNVVRRLVHSDLPLGTLRILFAILSFVFSIVAGGLCLKIWTKCAPTSIGVR
jgi:hypothetical protein